MKTPVNEVWDRRGGAARTFAERRSKLPAGSLSAARGQCVGGEGRSDVGPLQSGWNACLNTVLVGECRFIVCLPPVVEETAGRSDKSLTSQLREWSRPPLQRRY